MKIVNKTKKQSALALATMTALCAWMSCRTSDVAATPTSTPDAAVATPVVVDAGVLQPTAVPTTATIVFSTTPAARATVTWGKKRLGLIAPGQPLVVVRPRDSGPLDVVVRAENYLPVYTRAHTFSDSKVLVKLTSPEATNTLLGYRVPLDAGVPGVPLEGDGLVDPSSALGAPTTPVTAPPTP